MQEKNQCIQALYKMFKSFRSQIMGQIISQYFRTPTKIEIHEKI